MGRIRGVREKEGNGGSEVTSPSQYYVSISEKVKFSCLGPQSYHVEYVSSSSDD